MSIGLALFLIALIWFSIAYPGFRHLLLVCAALVAAVVLIAIANHYDNAQNASYRPATYTPYTVSVPQAPTPQTPTPPTTQVLPPPDNAKTLINSIQHGRSTYEPTQSDWERYRGADLQALYYRNGHDTCPAGSAWSKQEMMCVAVAKSGELR